MKSMPKLPASISYLDSVMAPLRDQALQYLTAHVPALIEAVRDVRSVPTVLTILKHIQSLCASSDLTSGTGRLHCQQM